MFLIGLLLLIIAVAAGVVVFSESTAATTSITVLNTTVELSQFQMFLTGVAAAVVFALGFAAMSRGLRHSLLIRRDLRRNRMEARRVRHLEEEKRELERRLNATAETRPTAGTTTSGTTTGGTTTGPDARTGDGDGYGDTVPPQRPAPGDRLVSGHRRPGDESR